MPFRLALASIQLQSCCMHPPCTPTWHCGMLLHGESGGIQCRRATGAGPHADVDRAVPPPQLLAQKETTAGHYMRRAGGLGPGAGGKPPSLVVRYAACGGLFNQHYCHVAGIAIAIALGADGVVSFAA